MIVGLSEFEAYLQEYFAFTQKYLQVIDKEIKQKIIPLHLLNPCRIIGTVSIRHGVSLEFREPKDKYEFEVRMVPNPILEATLPQRNSKKPMFHIDASRFISFSGLCFASEDFANKYLNNSNISCFKYIPPLDGFFEITTGEIELHDCKFGAIINGKPKLTEIKSTLWIHGKNDKEDYTIQKAQINAKAYIDVCLARFIHPDFNIGHLDQNTQTIERLNRKIFDFQSEVVENEKSEPEIQEYFEQNPDLLYLGTRYKRIVPHPKFEREVKPDLIPDFILERVNDGYCDILDIKLPEKKVVVGRKSRRRFSSDVDEAIAQVYEYREYLDDPQKRDKIEKEYKIKILKPNVLVLIGDSSNVETEEFIKIKNRRRDGEVITYQDIRKNMEALIELIRG